MLRPLSHIRCPLKGSQACGKEINCLQNQPSNCIYKVQKACKAVLRQCRGPGSDDQNSLQQRQAAAEAALRRMQRPQIYLELVEQEFLPQFQVDMFGRRFLVLDGPTQLGKTIFASNLAGPQHMLELNCASTMEPNLRDFDNDVHRAVVFDEASCAMVLRHKKLFQGGVQPLEMAPPTQTTTPTRFGFMAR